MAQQETGGGGTGEPQMTEEAQTQPETSNEAGTEMPAHSTSPHSASPNRAERRAQAKGKKNNGAGSNANLSGSAGRAGQGPRTSSHVGQVRFPRTGNK